MILNTLLLICFLCILLCTLFCFLFVFDVRLDEDASGLIDFSSLLDFDGLCSGDTLLSNLSFHWDRIMLIFPLINT